MFDNFLIFTEVVKLSSNVFWRMREINYRDKLLEVIYKKKDLVTFLEVIELIEDKNLISEIIDLIYKDDILVS